MLMQMLLSMPGAAEWLLISGVLLIFLVPGIFYLISLQQTLLAVSPRNRKMPAENVWLLLIPFFNLVYHFMVVGYISDSIKAEADERLIPLQEQRPAYSIGLAMCVLQCCTLIPVLNVLASLAALICWIIYWSKIVAYKNQLLNAGNLQDFGSTVQP